MPFTDHEKYMQYALKRKATSSIDLCGDDLLEQKFHFAMQNPVNAVVKFENLPSCAVYEGLTHQLVSSLSHYYSSTGEHLFGQCITEISFSGNHMGFGDDLLALRYLIIKNPPIKKLDLSCNRDWSNQSVLSCYFTDAFFDMFFIDSLSKNTNLIEINLDGNNISPEAVKKINQIILRNQKFAEKANLEANQKVSLTGLCLHTIFNRTQDTLGSSPLEKSSNIP